MRCQRTIVSGVTSSRSPWQRAFGIGGPLRAIPPEVYRNREEVARSIPDDPAEELGVTPAQRAEQARERRRHGGEHLSQYLREVPKPPV